MLLVTNMNNSCRINDFVTWFLTSPYIVSATELKLHVNLMLSLLILSITITQYGWIRAKIVFNCSFSLFHDSIFYFFNSILYFQFYILFSILYSIFFNSILNSLSILYFISSILCFIFNSIFYFLQFYIL